MPKLIRRLQSRLRRRQDEREREQREDFLKALYHYGLVCATDELLEHIRQQARISRRALPTILGQLVLEGLVATEPLRLTAAGRECALRLVRAHRIYEKYLAEHSGYSPEEWHQRAEEMEHKLSSEEQERIAKLLRNPLWDPHGDPIPTAGNVIPRNEREASAEARVGEWYRVLHIEDDDADCFRLIHRIGLAQGCIMQIRSAQHHELSITLEGEDCILPLAALQSLNLAKLQPSSPEVVEAQQSERLTRLRLGEQATIVGLSPACLGAMRRRLMDLGFVRGSTIAIDLASPMGNPTAYVVRNTAIALRADQARHILIRRD